MVVIIVEHKGVMKENKAGKVDGNSTLRCLTNKINSVKWQEEVTGL